MPSSRAIMSTCDSLANSVCTSPGARMCPPGTLLVYTLLNSSRVLGTAYTDSDSAPLPGIRPGPGLPAA
jgi:hypothetical protein